MFEVGVVAGRGDYVEWEFEVLIECFMNNFQWPIFKGMGKIVDYRF